MKFRSKQKQATRETTDKNELITIGRHKGEDSYILNPHEGQIAAMASQARFTFIFAGTQSGKTSFLPFWLLKEMDRCGKGDYLAVTSTYDLYKLKFLPEMRRVFVDMRDWGEFHAGDRTIYSHDGESRILLRSAASEGGLESATAKAAILDECGQDDFHLEAWEAVQRRLSLSQGRVLGATTLYNFGWLKSMVYDRCVKGDKNFNIIQFKSTMNPNFPKEEYQRMKEALPAWKFAMMYDGEFSRPAGMIFGDFNETRCVIAQEMPSQSELIVIGIDPGAVNTAILYGAVQKDRQRLLIWGESLMGNITTAEHAQSIREKLRVEGKDKWFMTVRVVGGAKSEKQFRMDMGREKIKVYEPPVSDVESGLDRIISLMKKDRLYITDKCPLLLGQIREYSRKVDAFGQPIDEIQDKEKFHMVDACRYLCTMVNITQATVKPKEQVSEDIPGFAEDKYLRSRQEWMGGDDRVPGLF